MYIEAMLAGCATIASKNGGVDGVIVDGENGFLSEQGNAAALTEKIRAIENLKNKDLNALRQNGIVTAIKYSDKNVAERYINDVLSWKNDL
mgnify:FL=1